MRYFEHSYGLKKQSSRSIAWGKSLFKKYRNSYSAFVKANAINQTQLEINRRQIMVIRDALGKLNANDSQHPLHILYNSLKEAAPLQRSLKDFIKENKGKDPLADQVLSLLNPDGKIMELLPKKLDHSLEGLDDQIAAIIKSNIPLPQLQIQGDAPKKIAIAEKAEIVLSELDRLKDKLGGAPNYGGNRPTALDQEDEGKTFFGRPMASWKEYLRNQIRTHRWPQFVWKLLGWYWNVGIRSHYESSSQSIQRLTKLIENKDKILALYDRYDKKELDGGQVHTEFGLLTDGLAWHFDQNHPSIEKLYIEMIEKFLTDDFEAAKNKGEDALIKYFYAFDGDCFEDKAKIITDYISDQHPLQQDDLPNFIIDTDSPVNVAYGQILEDTSSTPAGQKITKAFHQKLEQSGLYQMEFPEGEGAKKPPTLDDVHECVLQQQALFTMTPYEIDDLLSWEYEIFQKKGDSEKKEDFVEQLRRESISEVTVINDPNNPEGETDFSVNLLQVTEFLEKKFPDPKPQGDVIELAKF